jgi:AcrR family transcriptional regulator
LLVERTFDTLSVAEIIAAAGVSRASFYFYFAGKQAVLAELVRRAVGAGHEAAQPWVRSKAGPRETLRSGIDAGARLWLANAAVLRAIVESWASDPQLRDLWLAQMTTFTDAAIARIEDDRRTDPAGRGPARRCRRARTRGIADLDRRAALLPGRVRDPAVRRPDSAGRHLDPPVGVSAVRLAGH